MLITLMGFILINERPDRQMIRIVTLPEQAYFWQAWANEIVLKTVPRLKPWDQMEVGYQNNPAHESNSCCSKGQWKTKRNGENPDFPLPFDLFRPSVDWMMHIIEITYIVKQVTYPIARGA